MMFKGKKGVSIGGQIGGIAKGMGRLGKSAAPDAGRLAVNAGGAVAGSIPSGLGFGLGASAAGLLGKSAVGIKPLVLAVAFDIFVRLTGDFNALFGAFFQAVFAYLLIYRFGINESFLRLILKAKIAVVIYFVVLSQAPFILQFMPDIHRWFMLTVANHAFPIFTLYIVFTGFISNRTGGIIPQIIYTVAFFAILFWAYDQMQDDVNAAFERAGLDIEGTTEEQSSVFTTFIADLVDSSKNTGGKVFNAGKNAPGAIGSVLDGQIKSAGGEALFGTEKKDVPKLGLVIRNHPTQYQKAEHFKEFKAILFVENPPAEGFVEVSDITCTDFDSTISVRPEEFKYKFAAGETIKVFFNTPRTVTCTFMKTESPEFYNTGDKIKLNVQYDGLTTANLKTYFKRQDALEDDLIRQKDPLADFPNAVSRPTTEYDPGPIEVGIGPVELLSPPLGVVNGKVYPDFELILGNKKATYNGKIAKINNIYVRLPKGVELTKPEDCSMQPIGGTEYSTSNALMDGNKLKFTNIDSESRLFTCDINVTEEALLGADTSEALFEAAIDFTYETTQTLKANG